MFTRMASQFQFHISLFQKHQDPNRKVAIQPIRPIQRNQSEKGPILGRDSSKFTPLARKARRGTPKSRSGCQTCKIRHKKCDETKPACTQCTETGRECDFTEVRISKLHPPIPPRRSSSLQCPKSRAYVVINHPTAPLPSLKLTQQDGYYFQYLSILCSTTLTATFDTPLWSLLLQTCITEPCIRHAALGMAMMHQIYPSIVCNPSDASFIELYRSAFRHYAKAIESLKDRLAKIKGKADIATWEVSLLASFLFTAFEVVVGNEHGAYWQMDSAFRLMKSALSTYHSKSHALSLPGNLWELALAFNRLDIQSTTFSLWYETKAILPPSVPDTFASMIHARNVLDIIVANILSVVRSKGPEWYSRRQPNEPLPEKLNLQLKELKVMLQSWLEVFEDFLASNHLERSERSNTDVQNIRDIIAHHSIMIQHWISFIWLHTSFSCDQTVHDPYLHIFTTITDLAEEILGLQPSRRWYYTVDTQVVQPLFYVAQKCRDGNLRRRALRLLHNAGREGVWDGQCMATACAWIIAKEEEGLGGEMVGHMDASRKGFVEEKFRLRGETISYNRLGRTLRMVFKRKTEDGADELIEGFARWGDVSGVVYGEADKLWQDGALFE